MLTRCTWSAPVAYSDSLRSNGDKILRGHVVQETEGLALEMREQVSHISVEKIRQFRRYFDARGTAADDDDVEQLPQAFFGCARQRGHLESIIQPAAYRICVGNVPDKDGVFSATPGMPNVLLRHAGRQNHLVVRHLEALDPPADQMRAGR